MLSFLRVRQVAIVSIFQCDNYNNFSYQRFDFIRGHKDKKDNVKPALYMPSKRRWQKAKSCYPKDCKVTFETTSVSGFPN